MRRGCFSHSLLSRKKRLASAFCGLGRKVAVRGFTGVLALKKQTIDAQTLVRALTAAGEPLVSLTALNLKSVVYDEGPLPAGQPNLLAHLPPLSSTLVVGEHEFPVPKGILDFGFEVPDCR